MGGRRGRRVALFRTRWGGSVHVPIMNDKVEGFVHGIQGIPAVYGAALVADFDILQIVVKREVDEGHSEKAKPPGPGHENGADYDQRDARSAIEVLLNVQFPLVACAAAINEGTRGRRDDLIVGLTVLAGDRVPILRVADEPPLTTTAEVMDAGHDVSLLRRQGRLSYAA